MQCMCEDVGVTIYSARVKNVCVQVWRTWEWLYKCLWCMCEVCGWDFSQCGCDCLQCMEEEHGPDYLQCMKKELRFDFLQCMKVGVYVQVWRTWEWRFMVHVRSMWVRLFAVRVWLFKVHRRRTWAWLFAVHERRPQIWLFTVHERGCVCVGVKDKYVGVTCDYLQCMEEERGRRTCVWLFTVCMWEEMHVPLFFMLA